MAVVSGVARDPPIRRECRFFDNRDGERVCSIAARDWHFDPVIGYFGAPVLCVFERASDDPARCGRGGRFFQPRLLVRLARLFGGE